MKLFDVDISIKHIDFELDGRKYGICFRDSMRKGVYDVSVWVNGNKANVNIKGTYPPLKKVVRELWRIHFPLWMKQKIKGYRQLHNL